MSGSVDGYEVSDALETVAVVGFQHLKVKRINHDQQAGRSGTLLMHPRTPAGTISFV